MTEILKGNNEFYIEESGEVIARIHFISSGKDANGNDLIIVDHTIVNDGHSGKGLGKKLVHQLAEYAKENGKYIVPVCPYAKSILERSEEYRSILSN